NDDVNSNSQTLSNRLGKILRLNPDGTIPTDNPFYNTASGDNRQIWVYGLRNPFRFNVQPDTGNIMINDVGFNTWEELNVGQAGSHYYQMINYPNNTGNGALRRSVYTGQQAPSIGEQPRSQTAAGGTTATFEVRASGDAPLSYQWQRDGQDIPGATSSVYTTPT